MAGNAHQSRKHFFGEIQIIRTEYTLARMSGMAVMDAKIIFKYEPERSSARLWYM